MRTESRQAREDLAPPVREWPESYATDEQAPRAAIALVPPAEIYPFPLFSRVYSPITGKLEGTIGGYEDNGAARVMDAGPFDTWTAIEPSRLTATPPPIGEPQPTATRQRGNLQAGECTVGNALRLYYSYGTLIGYRPSVAAPATFTDAYYSVRTEAHAAEFGMNDQGTIVVPDPIFRAMVCEECRKLGHVRPPRHDFTRKDRPTAFPNSPFFGDKPARGENPSVGGHVFVERDPFYNPDCDANGDGYRVKALYLGMVKVDDSATGARRGDRKIRPVHLGYGPATEIVPPALCKTEGGYYSFPNADRPNRPGPQINRP